MAIRTQLAARRSALGHSQESLAGAIGVNTSTVSRWEQGLATPRNRLRTQLAEALELDPIGLDRLLSADDQPRLNEDVPAFLGHIVAQEQAAAEVHYFNPLLVPGLLQTEAYATAIERADPRPIADSDVKKRVQLRMLRQEALNRKPDPLRLRCVIDEAALARQVGDEEVMAGQLDHLLVQSTKPNIEVRIAPLGRSVYGPAFGEFFLVVPPGAAAPDSACTEDLSSVRFHQSPHEVDAYTALFETIYHRSLNSTDSLSQISHHRRNHR